MWYNGFGGIENAGRAVERGSHSVYRSGTGETRLAYRAASLNEGRRADAVRGMSSSGVRRSGPPSFVAVGWGLEVSPNLERPGMR